MFRERASRGTDDEVAWRDLITRDTNVVDKVFEYGGEDIMPGGMVEYGDEPAENEPKQGQPAEEGEPADDEPEASSADDPSEIRGLAIGHDGTSRWV